MATSHWGRAPRPGGQAGERRAVSGRRRQWVYPRTQELYQLLEKSARLRLQHRQLAITPVLVCRRVQFDTGRMAKQLGFHVIATWRQYVRPAVAAGPAGPRLFDEVNNELGYNLALHEGSVPQMVDQFTTVLPPRCQEASQRWADFVDHPEVPDLLTQMRDDSISNEDRHICLAQLADAAKDVFDEPAPWFYGHDRSAAEQPD